MLKTYKKWMNSDNFDICSVSLADRSDYQSYSECGSDDGEEEDARFVIFTHFCNNNADEEGEELGNMAESTKNSKR